MASRASNPPTESGTQLRPAPRAGLDLASWSQASKVALCSGVSLPFVIGWLVRGHALALHPERSLYAEPSFHATNLPFLWVQATGHAVLLAVALWARRTRHRDARALAYAEAHFWVACMAFSIWSVGAFTSPLFVLAIALPLVGYLLFDPAVVRSSLLTLGLLGGCAVVLPLFGVLPYAPFVARSPVIDGMISTSWVVSFGLPSVFVCVFAIALHDHLVRTLLARSAELEHASTTDQLTDLPNRRSFYATVAEVLASADVTGRSVGVLLVDADHFKLINDRRGHQAGDEALCALASRLRAALSPGASIARWGGEEFVVLLADADADAADRLADALTDAVRMPPSVPTVSIGVALREPGESFESALGRADQALYEAKRGGRDRVERARPARARSSTPPAPSRSSAPPAPSRSSVPPAPLRSSAPPADGAAKG